MAVVVKIAHLIREDRPMQKFTISMVLILLFCVSAYAHAEGGIEAIVRGNTAVVQIPCDWLYKYASLFHDPEQRAYGFQSNRFIADDEWLAQNLDEAEYTAFMADYSEQGYAGLLKIRDVGTICDPTDANYDRLLMNKRRIDDDWYIIFRQEELNFKHAVVYYPTTIYADAEGIEVIEQADESIPQELISTGSFRAHRAPDSRIYCEDCSFEIFSDLESYGLRANVAVITKALANQNFIVDAVLQLGENVSIDVSGYTEGENAIYCCVLTDSELQLLKDGMDIQLVPTDD